MLILSHFKAFVRFLSGRSVFFSLWALWLSAEYWLFGAGSYVRVHDTANTHIPVAMEFGRIVFSSNEGLIRGWLSGISSLANFGGMHLFHVPFAFLPAWLAHGLVTFVQRFVAGYFTARLMEDCLGRSRAVAYAAGVVYAVTHTDLGVVSFMHMLNEPGLPLLLWFFCSLSLVRSIRSIVCSALMGVGLGWAMSGLIGIYFLVPAAFLFVCVARSDIRTVRDFLFLILCFGIFTGVALIRQIPEIWALAIHAGESYRGQSFGMGGGANWGRFWIGRIRYLVGWWPFVLLSMLWIVRSRLNPRSSKAIGLLLFIGVLFGPFMDPLKFYVAPYIGFLRGVDFTRFHMVSALAWTMAAMSALEYLPRWRLVIFNPGEKKVAIWVSTQVACALIILLAFHWSIRVKQDHVHRIVNRKQSWVALFSHPDIGDLVNQASSGGYRFATAGAYYNLHPGFWLPYGADMADGHSPMYADRYYQFWSSVIRPLMSLDASIAGFHLWGSYVYLHHARTGSEHFVSAIPFQRWYNLDLLSLAGVRYVVSHKAIEDSRLRPVHLAGQEIEQNTWGALSGTQRIWRYLRGQTPAREIRVYENEAALERFFLVSQVRIFDESTGLREALESEAIEDLASAVFLLREELPDSFPELPMAENGQVLAIQNDGSRLQAEVTLPSPQVLVCSNQYYEWWRWTLNGEPLEVFPAYGAFMAAVVPAGHHVVELVYDPPYGRVMRRFAGL